jgi:hypothetical protein
MTQNLISLQFTPTDLAAIDAAIDTLEKKFAAVLLDLSVEQRHTLTKMGDKSEAFCRKALDILSSNPNVLPPTFDLVDAKRDLLAFDALRSRLIRVQKLQERLSDSQLALASDLMTAALEGYGYLKIAKKGEALESARKELSARFSRRPKKAEPQSQ